MTLTQIRSAVRTATRVPSSVLTDAELTTWINEGLYRVSTAERRWPWLQDSDTLTTVEDQQGYAIATAVAADVERVSSIYSDTKRRRLREIDSATAVDLYGGDMPEGSHADTYYVWAGSIYLIPTPDTADITYTVMHYKSPTALSADGDSPAWDVMFHDVLAFYCEMRVWLHEEELGKAQAAELQYLRRLEDMRRWYRDTQDDEPWAVGVPAPGRSVRTNTPFLDGL